MQTVRNVDDVVASMEQFQSDLPLYPDLAGRLGQAHAFYVVPDNDGNNRFGFSKFIGYRGLTAETYLNSYKQLNGINTEHALKPWFDEVKPGSLTYDELFEELAEWMAGFGKKPRGGDSQYTRIMVLKPEYTSQAEEVLDGKRDDRRLLNLIVAVADMLPVSQRGELRALL